MHRWKLRRPPITRFQVEVSRPRTSGRTALCLLLAIAIVAVATSACNACRAKLVRQRDSSTPKPNPPRAAAISAPLLEAAWEPWIEKSATPPNAHVAWEAENPLEHNFPKVNPFAPASPQEAAKLSSGQWIGSDKAEVDRFLKYRITVPKTGHYIFYARKFWKHGAFRYRFDDGPESVCGNDPLLLDSVELRKFVVANWVAVGELDLKKGEHIVRIDLLSRDSPAAFDQFLLSEGAALPREVLVDKEAAQAKLPGTYVPDLSDSNGLESLIDLRGLNEKLAGEHGPLRTDKAGHIVTRDAGEAIRFWGVNINHDALSLPPTLMNRYARWLASLGVNLVRLHGSFAKPNDIRTLDPDQLEHLRIFHQALKREGIYLGLSIYFPLWANLAKDSHYSAFGSKPPFGLYYYRDDFAFVLQTHWQQLLALKDTYSGIPLAKDPSLAYVEFANEDTTLFWSFAVKELPESERREVERQFASYVVACHGSIDNATSFWKTPPLAGDHPNEKRLAIMDLWQIAQTRDLRAQDTAAFLTQLMRNRFLKQTRYFREEAQYAGLTVCSNFHTADPRYLDPLDKWANAVCDVMDAHGYYEAPQVGEAATYSVRAGNRFGDRTALRLEGTADGDVKTDFAPPPVFALTPKAKPQIISELGWTWPNRFRAEFAALSAGYGSLQGIDGFTFFISELPSFAPTLDKFTLNDPSLIGQFPAAAIAFRRGLIKTAPAVATIALPEKQLFALKGLPLLAPQNVDSLRALKQTIARGIASKSSDELDPLAFWVGPIQLDFDSDSSAIDATLLRSNIDYKTQTVRSATGELTLNWKDGRLVIDNESVSIVAGFFPRDTSISTSHAELSLANEYASVFLVPLDSLPLSTSHRILLQIATESSQLGFVTEGTAQRQIKSLGDGPVVATQVFGNVRLRRKDSANLRVTALSLGGRMARKARGGADDIALLPNTMYYLIESR